jgi:hypothetical protein
MRDEAIFSDLTGKTVVKIEGGETGSDTVDFLCSDGSTFRLYHSQDCCESVGLVDIEGDIQDLIDSPIIQAEEVSDEDFETNYVFDYQPESHTWTFYKLATIKGYVTLRFLGESNGYYSEGMDFCKLN